MSVPIKAQITPDALMHDLLQIAESGKVGQLRKLLARGVDVNASNEAGVTALMVAAYHGRLEMVRALADHGANLNAMDSDGFTAAMLADHSGHEEIVRTLAARGAKTIPKTNVSETSSVQFTQDETFDDLSDSDAEPTGSNPDVRTLHDPPDIWDLVHETRAEFDPRSAFLGNITSINPLILVVIALIVGGGAVFGFMTLRGWSGSDHAASTALAPSSAPAASTAPAASNPPVAAGASAEAPLRAEDGNTKTTSGSQVTEPKRTALSSNRQATDTDDIAGSKVDSKITVVAPSALPDKRVVGKPRLQNPTSSTLQNPTSSTTTGTATVDPTDDKDKTQPSTTPAAKSDNEEGANPPAAKKEADKAPSPQLNAPAKASPTPKAKVIPWP